MNVDIVWVVVLGVLGACAGSFSGAFVYRFRKTHDDDGNHLKLSKKKQQQLSMLTGRSICESCQHVLAPKDLVPIASWLSTQGTCRYCRKSIGITAIAVEVAAALLFVGSYVWWPYGLAGVEVVQFVLWLIVVTGFVILSLYDLKWLLLPDKILGPVAVVAAGLTIIGISLADVSLTSVVLSAGIGGGLFAALYAVSGGTWIGFGDVKLGFVIGVLVADPLKSVFVLMLASFIGVIVSAPGLLKKTIGMKSHVPYGPMLMLAGYIVYIWGQEIIDWYSNIIGF